MDGRARTPCAPRRAEDCPPYLSPPSLTHHNRVAFSVDSVCSCPKQFADSLALRSGERARERGSSHLPGGSLLCLALSPASVRGRGRRGAAQTFKSGVFTMGQQSTQVANDAGFARIFKNPRFSVDDCGLSAKLSYVNAKGEKSGGGGAGGGRGRGWVRRCEGGGWRLEDGGGGGEKKMEDGRWRGRARAKREDGGGKMADGKGAFWTLLQRSVCGFAGASPYRLPFHPFPQGQKGQNQGESR